MSMPRRQISVIGSKFLSYRPTNVSIVSRVLVWHVANLWNTPLGYSSGCCSFLQVECINELFLIVDLCCTAMHCSGLFRQEVLLLSNRPALSCREHRRKPYLTQVPELSQLPLEASFIRSGNSVSATK